MATYSVATLADFYLLQDRLSDAANDAGTLDSSVVPLLFTVPALHDAEVVAAQADIVAAVPPPASDPIALAAAVKQIDTNLTSTVEPNILTLQNQVAALIANQQVITYDYTELAVLRRAWTAVVGVPAITITAAQAGTWVFSAYALGPLNGRAIGMRILRNGITMFEQSVDGSPQITKSGISCAIVETVAVGNVITLEINHDIGLHADISGKFRAAKMF